MNRLFGWGVTRLAFRPLYQVSQVSQTERLIQFTDVLDKQQLKEKQKISQGRSWKADELRLKSTEDLHKLWYVLLKEKNLLISDGIFYKKVIGSKGRMGKLSQVRLSMARLKAVVGERMAALKKYRKRLEDEYIARKHEEYRKVQEEREKTEIFVPKITFNLLRAKARHLRRGKDNTEYIEEAVAILRGKRELSKRLQKQYDYQRKRVIGEKQKLREGESEESVIRKFKSNVKEQIIEAVKVPQEEVLRQHVRNWRMLSLRQKRVILNLVQARRARESKAEFLREVDLLGQKIRRDLEEYNASKQQQQQ